MQPFLFFSRTSKYDIRSRNHIYATNPPRFQFGRKKSKFSVVLLNEAENIHLKCCKHLVPLSLFAKTYLGYDDLRSAIKWCKKNDVIIQKSGMATFVNIWSYEVYLLRCIKNEYDKRGKDGAEIIDAIQRDDKLRFCELIGDVPVSKTARQNYLDKKKGKKSSELSVDELLKPKKTT